MPCAFGQERNLPRREAAVTKRERRSYFQAEGKAAFRDEGFMKKMMMVLALSVVSMPLASAREQSETFLIRQEAKRQEMAKKEILQPMEETAPEQVCIEEKSSCEKC